PDRRIPRVGSAAGERHRRVPLGVHHDHAAPDRSHRPRRDAPPRRLEAARSPRRRPGRRGRQTSPRAPPMIAEAPGDAGLYEIRGGKMVDRQIIPRGVREPLVLEAMREIPREIFVEEALRGRAYADSALPIGFGQTISQPYIAARMTELLAPTRGD